MDFTTTELRKLLVMANSYLDRYESTFESDELKVNIEIVQKIRNELNKRMEV